MGWFINFLKWLFGASEGFPPVLTSTPNTSGGNLTELLAGLEGVRYRPYKDPIGLDTIGVGHLIIKNDTNLVSVVGHQDVSRLTQYPMTHSQVLDLLDLDLRKFKEVIGNEFPVLTQYEEDALVSLCFNIGESAFKRSTLVAYLRGNVARIQVAKEFPKWRMVGGRVLPGLQTRRAVEASVFMGYKLVDPILLVGLTARQINDVQKHLHTYWG